MMTEEKSKHSLERGKGQPRPEGKRRSLLMPEGLQQHRKSYPSKEQRMQRCIEKRRKTLTLF